VCGLWQINPTGKARATYHLVAKGECWLHMRNLPEPLAVRQGDLMFFPNDTWHLLTATRDRQGEATMMPALVSGPYTQLVCGMYSAEDRELERLFSGLPSLVLIRADEGGSKLTHLVGLLAEESEQEYPGTSVVLDGLSDALLALVLRHCIERSLIAVGMLAGLGDPRLAELMLAIHRQPGRDWNLESMAHVSALSRSSFSERFLRVVGLSPGQYLSEVRMAEAVAMLKSGDGSVAQIAERLGYATEAAFRRAFRRVTGHTPGEARRQHVGSTDSHA
jgi:AraC-like DNA-binding protein